MGTECSELNDGKRMMVKYKASQAYAIRSADTSAGTLELIASVYGNVDRHNERVVYGFYDKSIELHKNGTRTIKGVYMHDVTRPIAKTLELVSIQPKDAQLPQRIKDNGGLFVRAEFNLDTQIGSESYSNLVKGIIDQYSVGISIEKEVKSSDGVIDFVTGWLWEWSPVLFGANDMTQTLAMDTLQDHFSASSLVVNDLVGRLQARVAMRVKEGRRLSSDTVTRIEENIALMEEAATKLRALLDGAPTVTDTQSLALMQAVRRRYNNVIAITN